MKIGTKANIVLFIIGLAYIGSIFVLFRFLVIPGHVQTIEQQSWDLAYSLQQVSPLLNVDEQQRLFQSVSIAQKDLRYALILDKNGKVMVHSDPKRVGMIASDQDREDVINERIGSKLIWIKDNGQLGSPLFGKKVIDVMIPYYDKEGNYFGAVKLGLSMQRVDNLILKYRLFLLIISILLVLVLLLVKKTISRNFIIPIKNMALATRKAQGGTTSSLPEERSDEIGILAREYDLMTERTDLLLEGLQKRERELQEYIDQLLTINCKMATDGTVLMINAEMARYIGPASDKIVGNKLWDYPWGGFREEDGQRIQELLVLAASGITVCSEEFNAINEGQWATLDVGIRPVFDADKQVAYLVVEALDISDRKQAEHKLKVAHDELEIRVKERTAELEKTNEVLKNQIMERKRIEKALLESESHLQKQVNYLNTLIKNLNEFFFVYDEEGYITFANNKSFSTLGYTSEELIGMHASELIPDHHRLWVNREIEDRLEKGLASCYETPVICKDGQDRVLKINSSPIVENGKITGGMALGEDITDYLRTQEHLRISEEKFSAAFRLSPDLISITSADGRIIEVNDSLVKQSGYRREEVIGRTALELNIWVYPYEMDRIISMLRKNGIVMNVEASLRNKSGGIRRVLCSLANININGELCTLFQCHDITERKTMEEDLAREKEQLQVTLRSIGEGVIATDIEGRMVLGNEVAEKILGRTHEQLIGRKYTTILKELDVRFLKPDNLRYKEFTDNDSAHKLTYYAVFSDDGEERIVEITKAPMSDKNGRFTGIVWAIRDITYKQKMEEEMLKASKLESLGVLAGGIAHDFNNLLTVVVGNLALSKMMLKDEDEIIEYLTEAEKASFQAKGLTQQLLTFARGGAPIKKTAVLDNLIKDSVGLALSGSNVAGEITIAEDLWAVDIDEGQMNQVINNLIINAVQAMPGGGCIKISADNITVLDDKIPSLPEGRYICIAFEDYGTGIPEELHNRIFDPYFTTKTMGSGLGLATSYSVVRKHDGYITLESQPGKGSTFYVYLPASTQIIDTKSDGTEGMVPGRGKILIMDDDVRIREVAGQILDSIGYEVDLAKDGEETIELYYKALQAGEKYNLVVIDLTIPGGIGGLDTARMLLNIDPAVKLIVSSGYSNDPVMAEFKKWGFRGVIAKPYGIRELSETIGRIINEN